MEIERKFLIDLDMFNQIEKPVPSEIVQAYISTSPECTVRVRIKNEKAFLTLKGKTIGISRSEYEYEIPLIEGKEMIEQFTSKVLHKLRYEIEIEGHLWEIDVFQGQLAPLVIAEIELKTENESFFKPDWILKEVSDDAQYYNSNLINRLK